jgi:hypothetical protein
MWSINIQQAIDLFCLGHILGIRISLGLIRWFKFKLGQHQLSRAESLTPWLNGYCIVLNQALTPSWTPRKSESYTEINSSPHRRWASWLPYGGVASTSALGCSTPVPGRLPIWKPTLTNDGLTDANVMSTVCTDGAGDIGSAAARNELAWISRCYLHAYNV